MCHELGSGTNTSQYADRLYTPLSQQEIRITNVKPIAGSADVFVGSILFVLSASAARFAADCDTGAVGGSFALPSSVDFRSMKRALWRIL